MLHKQEWGKGRPLIAVHGLGLESTSFAGLALLLDTRGIRTISVDLPGFGKTPAPDGPLTPRALAEPVIELAGELGDQPLLLGMSLGGRVALEAALLAPDAFRGVIAVAPALPRERPSWLGGAHRRVLDPALAERIPLEAAWPLLKRMADAGESKPEIAEDWFKRIAQRTIYFMSCPATRVAFVSAIREMAEDPATGPESVWARLPSLVPPAAFVWGGRDRMIPPTLEQAVAERLHSALHLRVPCAGHYRNGPHFRCHLRAMAEAAVRIDARSSGPQPGRSEGSEVEVIDCIAEAEAADFKVERLATS